MKSVIFPYGVILLHGNRKLSLSVNGAMGPLARTQRVGRLGPCGGQGGLRAGPGGGCGTGRGRTCGVSAGVIVTLWLYLLGKFSARFPKWALNMPHVPPGGQFQSETNVLPAGDIRC